MSEKNMPPCYWAEATSTAYTVSKTPTTTVHDVTLEEKFTRKKPDVSHFKVFGCIAYVHVPDELRTKLELKAEKCVFIGYSVEQKGYKCYNPITRQVRVSRDVVFDEMETWYADVKVVIGADINKSVAENSDARKSVAVESSNSTAQPHTTLFLSASENLLLWSLHPISSTQRQGWADSKVASNCLFHLLALIRSMPKKGRPPINPSSRGGSKKRGKRGGRLVANECNDQVNVFDDLDSQEREEESQDIERESMNEIDNASIVDEVSMQIVPYMVRPEVQTPNEIGEES
ncbi:hypothetical protein L7F22_062471 [Adiantum nelumboides]|nr:hypothetical protein [Adiantum nelumboides]